MVCISYVPNEYAWVWYPIACYFSAASFDESSSEVGITTNITSKSFTWDRDKAKVEHKYQGYHTSEWDITYLFSSGHDFYKT